MMAYQSVSVLEKPIQHLALADWHARVGSLRNVADARRKDAFDVRQDACRLRYETRIETNWVNYETNEALYDRVNELNRWQSTVRFLKKRLETEIKILEDEKASAERELDGIQLPISVISECLTMRDCRLDTELTYDSVDVELKEELTISENNQRLLNDQCKRAWEKMTRLQAVLKEIIIELENLKEASEVEINQLDLNQFSTNITYKTKPKRNPKNSTTYEGWKENTNRIRELVDQELSQSYAIRETLFVCREKARNLLNSQQERTEKALRRRIFETQRLRNELKWQQLKINDEMSKLLGEIRLLEQSLCSKTNPLKLAETRLENRAQRPGMELCLDTPHNQLCLEVDKLRTIQRRLIEQIEEAKSNYNKLEEHANKIDRDLEKKEHSLITDQRTLDMRERLRAGEFSKKTTKSTEQTQRNIMLTRMEQEIPKD